jgi:hypothetical protein
VFSSQEFLGLAAFTAQPLQQGVPTEGWVCFLTREVREALLKNASIKLTIVDSFGHQHAVRNNGPWPCKGDIGNPDVPW